MEDWDARPPAARPAPGTPWHLVAVAAVGAMLLYLLFAVVLVRIGGAGDPAGTAITEEQAAEAARLFAGDSLTVANPDPLNLAAGETLILRDRDDVVRVTPGPLTVRGGKCGAATVAVTVRVGSGAAGPGPSAFRLRTTRGVDLPVLDCGDPAGPDSFTLAVAEAALTVNEAPGQLVYAPDGGEPQARWLLA